MGGAGCQGSIRALGRREPGPIRGVPAKERRRDEQCNDAGEER
jgi:hypothetical protein